LESFFTPLKLKNLDFLMLPIFCPFALYLLSFL
jgi:hypothetical protein